MVLQHLRNSVSIAVAMLGPIAVVATFMATKNAAAESPSRQALLKLLPEDGGDLETYGSSVAIDGATAVIGADGTGSPEEVPGVVYVLRRHPDGAWTQLQRIVAPDGPANNFFGASVAVSGDTLIAGAPFDDDHGEASGSAYVYRRSAGNHWLLEQKLIPSNAANGTRAGMSVGIDGERAVMLSDGVGVVFHRDTDGNWNEEAILAADDGVRFVRGIVVAPAIDIYADTVVATAPADNVNGFESGSAYVFLRAQNGVWSQQTKLVPGDGAEHNLFGGAVSIDGDRIAVGGIDFDYPFPNLTPGKAYVFERDDANVWMEHPLPTPVDLIVGDRFGKSITVDGDTVVVGQATSGSQGSAYVFAADEDGEWTELLKLVSDPVNAQGLGFSVALDDDTVLAGGEFANDAGLFAGAAFVYATLLLPQDINNDGVINLADLATFAGCLTGPQAADLAPACESADLDGDSDADLQDFALLANAF